jgi:hypothetical protein
MEVAVRGCLSPGSRVALAMGASHGRLVEDVARGFKPGNVGGRPISCGDCVGFPFFSVARER